MKWHFSLLSIMILMYSCQYTKPSFVKLESSKTNITFNNKLHETHTYNYFTYPYMYLGGGVAVGDINNDGLEDLYFTGNMVSNKLYLNKGAMKFEDISMSAGVEGDERWFSGVTMIDINQDGYLDIYCAVGGKNEPNENVLYINNGNNTFSEKAKEYGIADNGYSMHSTFFDYDKDGDLDLYVANYPPTSFTAPVDYYKYMLSNHSERDSDHLYRNDNGKFIDVTQSAGVSNFGLSLGVVASDLNNDGYPDLYISNDFNAPDFLYINQKDGTFSNVIGYYAVARSSNKILVQLMGNAEVDKELSNTSDENDSSDKSNIRKASDAVLKMVGNTSILINQITPENFMEMWTMLIPVMKVENQDSSVNAPFKKKLLE